MRGWGKSGPSGSGQILSGVSHSTFLGLTPVFKLIMFSGCILPSYTLFFVLMEWFLPSWTVGFLKRQTFFLGVIFQMSRGKKAKQVSAITELSAQCYYICTGKLCFSFREVLFCFVYYIFNIMNWIKCLLKVIS